MRKGFDMSNDDTEKLSMEERISYWMGVVDTRLSNLTSIIQEFLKSDERNWERFHEWQTDVNKRLQNGNQQFENHDIRLSRTEDDVKSLEHDVKELQVRQGTSEQTKPLSELKDSDDLTFREYISWTWVRDKILVPVIVWAIIIGLGYLLVHSINIQ